MRITVTAWCPSIYVYSSCISHSKHDPVWLRETGCSDSNKLVLCTIYFQLALSHSFVRCDGACAGLVGGRGEAFLSLARHHLHVNSRAPRVFLQRAIEKVGSISMVEEALIFATPNLEDEQAAPFYLLTHSARRMCVSLCALCLSGENKHCVYIYDRHT